MNSASRGKNMKKGELKMDKFKTWEIIKILQEDSSRKFKSTEGVVVGLDRGGNVALVDTLNITTLALKSRCLHAEWEEI